MSPKKPAARLAAAVAIVTVAILAAAVIALASRSGTGTHKSGDLVRLQQRLDRSKERLRRAGIFVMLTGQGERCVRVGLANPTPPNVSYLRRTFGSGLCVMRAPAGEVQACGDSVARPIPRGAIAVPDLVGQSLYEAERRTVAAKLRYFFSCAVGAKGVAARPSRYALSTLARVTAQCPVPGEPVQEGAVITVEARAALPGGFTHLVTGFQRRSGDERPCADGRVP
jgi:hypothetical protein